MAGLLEALMRRAAPGAYQETPEEQYRKSVMSPDYRPETDGRQLLYGGIRGLLDATPAGMLDAAQAGLNRLPTAGGALVRAVTGRAQGPVEAGMGLLGMQGSGPGYEAGRAASGAAVAGMGLLGNQAGGQLPRGYARDQSGAIVWHGSPHKFDKFDSSKIGTGEGAQAYGHGLYLADAKDVASSYKTTLAGRVKDRLKLDGKAVDPDSMLGRSLEDVAKFGPKYALQQLDDSIRFNEKYAPDMANLYKDVRAKIEQISPSKVSLDQGALYQVDLPDEQIARMLDWDKPLSQQPEAVRKAAIARLDELRKLGGTPPKDPSGEWLHKAFHPQAGEAGFGQDLAASSLRKAGIPGIRYLDGGSRTAGAGTSNYVVFPGNEGLLKILSRE